MTSLKRLAVHGFCAFGIAACTPGYMKVDDLNRREQGPEHCAARCHELGMEMGAMVLVSNTLPGCVCTPRPGTTPPPAPPSAPPSAPQAAPPPPASVEGAPGAVGTPNAGAAGATTGYAVVLAAAAAAHQQQMQTMIQQQQQQQYIQHSYHH